MPDISMCKNEKCNLRHKCYRFTATPSPEWQSYANFEPNKSGQCDFFMKDKRLNDTKEEKEVRRK